VTSLQQIIAITVMNLKGLKQRFWQSSAAIFSIALVITVMVGFLSMADGFEKTVAGTGSDKVVIILRQGSQAELNSFLSLERAKLLSSAPGVAKQNGKPLASFELYVIVDLLKRSTGLSVNVPMRGIDRTSLNLRENVKIIEGRMFEPGRNEIVVGHNAREQFAGLDLGDTISFGATKWQVVGVFDAGGSVFESELWADAKVVQTLFRRGTSYQSVRMKLAGPDSLQEIKAFAENDPRLNVEIRTEADYYAEQSEPLTNLIRWIGYPLAFVMALGALAGALNTMYTSVLARMSEITTLRALGFGAFSSFIGILTESIVIAIIGSVIGLIMAYVFFDGMLVSTLSGASFTQTVFEFSISPQLVKHALALSIVVGFVGGFFPALRASRMPIADAFRITQT